LDLTKKDIRKWLVVLCALLFSFPLVAQEEKPIVSGKYEKSLKANPEQEKIQKLIEAVKNEINDYLR
jgi:hypothetical protein